MDDSLELSSAAQNALREFYAERERQQTQFDELKAQSKGDDDDVAGPAPITMEAFTEDWGVSQFWNHDGQYDDQTATTLAEQLLAGADEQSCIAVVSAPSVFVKMRQLLAAGRSRDTWPTIWLFECDRRFDVLEGFCYYDFNRPLQLPAHLKGRCDRIICDPPFLSENCQTKTAVTVQWLAQPGPSPRHNVDNGSILSSGADTGSATSEADRPRVRIVTCTGATMTDIITARLYRRLGVRTTTFRPRHSNALSNEFRCFANFECADWTWEE